MAFCGKCGADMKDGKFCPSCGAPADGAGNAGGGSTQGFEDGLNKAAKGVEEKFNKFNNTKDTTADYDAADIQAHKATAWLAYIGPLFLIPLLAFKDSKYSRFHAIQGATMCALWVASWIVTVILSLIPIPMTGHVFGAGFTYYGTPLWMSLIIWVIEIFVLVFAIVGIINAATGKAKELPLIGKIKFFK